LDGSRCVAWGSRPDGQLVLATGDGRGNARIWNPDTGQLLHTLNGHTGFVGSVAWGYQPDGRPLLATGCDDAIARIWDPNTGRLLHTLNGHASNVLSVAWGYQPDGQPRLATACLDGSVRIWSADGAQFIDQTLTPEAESLISVRWAPTADGRSVLAVQSAERWYLWDCVTSRRLYAEARDFGTARSDNLDLAVDPRGRLLLATPIPGRRVRIWEIVLDPPVKPPPATSPTDRLPRERVKPPIAKPVTIFDPPEDVTPGFGGVPGNLVQAIFRVACTVSVDGQLLAAAVADTNSELHIWNLSTGLLLRTIARQRKIWSVSWETGQTGGS
jgi:WD40 repeat protein